jgi:hypothetical protein
MTWPPDIAGDLPAPRDDEPASLRQDIADELADHLASAFNRELHFTPEETAAKQTVLERFGDPRRIARQLWFDAMKEKIMSQRLLIGALLVTAVACLGSTGLTFVLVAQTRQANQALLEQVEQSRKANEAFLERSQVMNATLLEKLAGLGPAAPAGPPASMEWNSVKFRLVCDKSGGTPANGFEVRLHGHLLDTAKEIDIVRKTGSDGIADMGLVRPGQHALMVCTPWNESRSESSLTVLPGRVVNDEIICPAVVPVDAATSFSVDWPEDLKPKELWLVADVLQLPRKVGDQFWAPSNAQRLLMITATNGAASPPLSDSQRFIPLAFNYRMRGIPPNQPVNPGLYYEPPNNDRGARRGRGSPEAGLAAPTTQNATDNKRPYRFVFQESPDQPEVRWPAARYRLQSLLVAEAPAREPVDDLQSASLLGGLIANFNQNAAGPLQSFQGQLRNFAHPFSDWRESPFPGNNEKSIAARPIVEIKPGESNHITIGLPVLLADHVRRFLEPAKQPD